MQGDALTMLKTLPDESVQCCICSPPYWGLRDYGIEGQLGLESTPEEYIAKMVAVFSEVRRVLRKDGTLWLNCGDSYASGIKGDKRDSEQRHSRSTLGKNGGKNTVINQAFTNKLKPYSVDCNVKPKDLIGIPWMLAFALRADGWYLRCDIIWSKLNPMPESVQDRPTRAHEYVFLLTKSRNYFYDAEAIAEEGAFRETFSKYHKPRPGIDTNGGNQGNGIGNPAITETRNKRSVWTIATEPFPEAHFATFPTKLVEPCILAGTKHGDTVLDPFCGSGTVGVVALKSGRNFIGIELNQKYADMAEQRIYSECPMFAEAL